MIGISPTLGIRSVIADRDYKAGELIEACPIILLPKKEWSHIEETILGNYWFEWNRDNSALLLGNGSIYNHSYTPNALYKRDYRKLVMRVEAYKDIKAGEEIVFNYNGVPDSLEVLEPEFTDFSL